MTRVIAAGASRKSPRYVVILRFLFAALLLVTATGKLLDIRGFADVLATYRVLPEWLKLPSALALSATELGLAIWLLSGARLSLAALAVALLHLMFFVWAAVGLARGFDIPNCGCFGVFWPMPLTLLTLAEDATLIILALLLFRGARQEEMSAAMR